MEVLYGIVVLLAFILGLGIGLSIPFFVKKYVESIKKDNEKTTIVTVPEQKEHEIKEDIKYYPKDLLDEWFTGEEVKHDE